MLPLRFGHAPVSLAVLLELGGHAHGFNRELSQEVTRAAEQFMDEVSREDKIAIWKHSEKVEELADFSQGHEGLASLLLTLDTPGVSETNLYDATIFATEQMRTIAGRKAIILISSGIHTFSKAHCHEVCRRFKNAVVHFMGSVLREFSAKLRR